MPKLAAGLTDVAVRNARPKKADFLLADGNGLHLRVSVAGTRSWLVRYRASDGGQKKVVIGTYPQMSLADARVKAADIHLSSRTGRAVEGARGAARQLAAAAAAECTVKDDHLKFSFSRQSEQWLLARKPGWAAETHRKAQYVVRHYLQPAIGPSDMRTLRTRDVAEALRAIATKAPSLAKKAVQYLNGVVDFCIIEGIREDDQVMRLKGIVPSKRGGHVPAVTRERGIGPLVNAITAYEGFVIRSALMFAAWTALRPGVIATARWSEIDLPRAEWHISALEEDGRRRMKTGHDHIVSLPRQAVAMLREMHKLSGGDEHVFPAVGKRRNQHLHRDSLSKALRDMGFAGAHTTHGFRAMLRTVARERLRIDLDVLEAQLAHAKRDEIQAAYDRTAFTDERREAMQRWADYLDQCAKETAAIEG